MKRANGEGSIFRRANGAWAGELTYLDPDGRTKRRTLYGRTQAEVRSKLREARARADAGQPVRDATITLSTWLEVWIGRALEVSDRSRSTKDQYASLARTHLGPALGHLPLDRLRPTDVEGLIVRLRASGLSASTVRSAYTVLRRAGGRRTGWPGRAERRRGGQAPGRGADRRSVPDGRRRAAASSRLGRQPSRGVLQVHVGDRAAPR